MRAERFGSYSTVDTLAGMSFLSRLKSMMRYSRLCPPPRHHDVISPRLLRPPERCRFSVSGRYGSAVVISSKVCTVRNRVPGDVGLNLRIGISLILVGSGLQAIGFPAATGSMSLTRPGG